MWYRKSRIGFILLLGLGLSACDKPAPQNHADQYPWQITVLPDGGSRIFGIRLGVTTVGEVMQLAGNTPKIALFENPGGGLSLELFYSEFTRAGLTGRLVLTIAATDKALQAFKQQAVKKDRLESGVLQYSLDSLVFGQITTWPVASMTYVPYANLEEKIIVGRFGEPAEKIRSHEHAEHWLYPDKGLDLIVNDEGKEILQYVPPPEFERLARPLRR